MTQQERVHLDLATVNWEEVLPRFMDKKFLSKNQGPCPICGGKDRFRFDNKEGKGTWFCNKCRAGNGLTLVAKVLGFSNKEAADEIAGTAKVVPIRPYVVSSRKEPSRDDLRSKLQALWDEAVPVTKGDPVSQYLLNRVPGLTDIPGPGDLRFFPKLIYWEAYKDAKGRTRYRDIGKFPALLTKIRDSAGRPVNLQRIYLSSDGHKADLPIGENSEKLPCKKQMTGVAKSVGGGIHLYRPDGTGRLGVGEGLETMLAVRTAYHNSLPVWPLLSELGVRRFVIPAWVTELHIFSDNDLPDEKGVRVGQQSAAALFRRALKEGFVHGVSGATGRKVFLHVPKKEGEDFADQWMSICKDRYAA